MVVTLNVSCKQRKSTVSLPVPFNGVRGAGKVSSFFYLDPQGIRYPETHRADCRALGDGVLRGLTGGMKRGMEGPRQSNDMLPE